MPSLVYDKEINLRSFVQNKIRERLEVYCNQEFAKIFAAIENVDEDIFQHTEERINELNETEVDIPFSYDGIRRRVKVKIIFDEGVKYYLELAEDEVSLIEEVKSQIKGINEELAYGVEVESESEEGFDEGRHDSDSQSDLFSNDSYDGEYYDEEEEDYDDLGSQDREQRDIDDGIDYEERLEARAQEYLENLLEHIKDPSISEVESEIEEIRADLSETLKDSLIDYLATLENEDGTQMFTGDNVSEFRRLILSDLVFSSLEEYDFESCMAEISQKNISDQQRRELQGSFFDISQNFFQDIIQDSNFSDIEQRFAQHQENGELVSKQRILYAINESIVSKEDSFIREQLAVSSRSLAEAEAAVTSWIKIFSHDNIVRNFVYESSKSEDQIINVEAIFAKIKKQGDLYQKRFEQEIIRQCEFDREEKQRVKDWAFLVIREVIFAGELEEILGAYKEEWENVADISLDAQIALVESIEIALKGAKKDVQKKPEYKDVKREIATFNNNKVDRQKIPNFNPNILWPVMVFTIAKEPSRAGHKAEKTIIAVPIIINRNRFILSANTRDGVFGSHAINETDADLLRAQAAYAQNQAYADLVGEVEAVAYDQATMTRWKRRVPSKPDITLRSAEDLNLWSMISSDSERVLLEALSQENVIKNIVDDLETEIMTMRANPDCGLVVGEGEKLKIYATTLVMYSTNNVCEYCTKAIAGQLKDWQRGEHRGMMINLATEINSRDSIWCYEKDLSEQQNIDTSTRRRVGLRSNAVVIAGREYRSDRQYHHTDIHPETKTLSTTNLRIKEMATLPSFIELVQPDYPDVSEAELLDLRATISGNKYKKFERSVINSAEENIRGAR